MKPASINIRPEFSPRSILMALIRRRWLVGGIWFVATALILAFVSRLESVYTANAVILVESQKIPETFVTATVQTTLEARLDMLKQQVLSRDRLWSLVESLGLYAREREQHTAEEVLTLMRDDIKINLARGWSARGPGAFQVVYEAPKAEWAAEVANRVGNFFITENLRQRTGEAAGTSEFLDKQLESAEQRLRAQESILKEFKLTHNGELPQQEAALLASMGQSRTELLGIQEAIGRAQQNKLMLENSVAYGRALLDELQQATRRPAEGRAAPSAPNQPLPLTRLQVARAELRGLRARYYDEHPDVIRATKELARIEREESAQVTATPPPEDAVATAENRAAPVARATAGTSNQRIDELQAQIELVAREIQVLENRRSRVLSDIADMQNRVRGMPVREQQLASILRDYETSKTNYDSLLNKKLAADVAFSMEQWQKSQRFVLLDAAKVPQKPTRPRRALIAGAGSIVSLFGAFLLAFVIELRANVLLGDWELPDSVNILGRIPVLPIHTT